MHLLSFVSTLFILIGIFLPWIDPSLFVQVTRGIDMKDGRLILVLGLTASFISIIGILRGMGVLRWFYLFFGLLCFCISGADLYFFWKSEYNVGPGIYLTLIGGAQLALSPLLALVGRLRG